MKKKSGPLKDLFDSSKPLPPYAAVAIIVIFLIIFFATYFLIDYYTGFDIPWDVKFFGELP